jgi:hypothetical protein
MLVVSQSQSGERIYSNITTAAPVAPGTPISAPSVVPLCYGPGRDPAVFAMLPEWVRKAVIAGGAAPAYQAPAPVMPAAPAPAGYVTPAPAPMAATAPTVPAPNVQTAPQVNPGVPFDDQLSF